MPMNYFLRKHSENIYKQIHFYQLEKYMVSKIEIKFYQTEKYMVSKILISISVKSMSFTSRHWNNKCFGVV